MRKVLVVLLVLSVLGGVFAQGSWWVGASASMGVVLDFEGDDGKIYVGNNLQCCCMTSPHALLSANYSDGGLTASLTFGYAAFGHSPDHPGKIMAALTYWGDNYAFGAQGSLDALLNDTTWFDSTGNDDWVGLFQMANPRLWGYYKFLDGMVHLEGAISGRHNHWWQSDTSTGWIFNGNSDELGWSNLTYTNGLITNVSFAGLEFGVVLKDFFTVAPGAGLWSRGAYAGAKNITDVFDTAVFGVKFAMDPVEFAAHFLVDDVQAYLGMRWFAGALTLGLNFEGKLGVENDDTTQFARFGAGVDYNGGAFGAGVKAGYAVDMIGDGAWEAGLVPSFWYNVLPNNLLFRMYARLLFTEDDFDYGFAPALFWNFKGTGAGALPWDGGVDTGIGIGYRFGTIGAFRSNSGTGSIHASENFNEVNIVFRWAM